jgi:hypothetical protein
MPESQVPVRRTVVTLRDYVRAVMKAWPAVDQGPCTKGACAVLWAQYMIETGGAACWNFNVGNVKHVRGDSFDYHCLSGVWEGVTEPTAAALVASGQATRDPSGDHARAVGPGKVSVLFQPPHPATWFRAFPSLDVAMQEHLKLLAHRFAPAWPWVIAGDYRAFATALRARGYFTASADAYANGMRRAYEDAMSSSAWNDTADALAQDAVPTMPELPASPSEPTIVVDPTVHVDPSSYLRPEEWDTTQKG